jgi:hypothetical protein
MADSTPHAHTSSCYKWLLNCGRSEHVHGSRCNDRDGNITCGRGEHSHSGSCDIESLYCNK